MNELWKRLFGAYLNTIWAVDTRALGRPHAILVRVVRLLHGVLREVMQGDLTLRAMSLVYTTLLSLVPLLAVSFSVLKALGVHNQIEPLLFNFFEPMGDKGLELGQRIFGFVENVKVGVLGSLGLVFLFYTVVSLVQKVEEAFNYVWHIKRPRRLVRRFSDYMSVILVGPVLVVSALGITATVMGTDIVRSMGEVEPLATLLPVLSKLVPYFLICAAFTFVFIFIPNTKVHFTSALVGGLVSGVLWQTAGMGFAAFVANSTKYTAIYSGFAILVIFLIWLYVSWLVLLLGAQVAYFHQHPQLLSVRREDGHLSNWAKERLAMLAMLLIGYYYYHNRGLWTDDALAARLGVPPAALVAVLDILEMNGFVNRTADDPPAYFPGRDMETISLQDLLLAVRRGEESAVITAGSAVPPPVDEMMTRVEGAIHDALGERTVKDMVLSYSETETAEQVREA